MSLLSVRNLGVTFGSSAVVEDVSFDIAAGEKFALVGESGSGKSVTMQAAVGLVQAKGGRIARGSVKFEGQELVGLSQRALNRIRGDAIGFIKSNAKS